MELLGRSVLVTGATGVLGQAVARRLAAEGCVLTVTGRRGEVLERLGGELDARVVMADLARRDEVQRLADTCADVDILVAAANMDGRGELTGYSVDQVDRLLEVNLRAPVALGRLLGERMLERGRGHLVFVSSLSGKVVEPGASLFSAAKFGLRGFALALRQDWAPRGVGVSCVNLGPIQEDGGHSAEGALPAGFQPRSTDDVAAAVVKAVKHDRAEVDVADPVMRAGVVLGQLAPRVAATFNRLAGDDQR